MSGRAGFLIRSAAGLIDGLIGVFLGLVLSGHSGWFFAGRAVVMLKIGSAGTIWKGPLPMVLGILGPFVYGLPFAILLVLLAEPLLESSPGGRLLGLRVRGDDGAKAGRARLWRRTFLKTIGFWGLTLALILESWQAAVLFMAAGGVVFLGFFLVLAPSRQAFFDRLSRTAVYHT